jgi:hypothetical protein
MDTTDKKLHWEVLKGYVTHCFLAKDVEKIREPHLENTEDLSVHLFSCEEVKKMLENNEIKQSLMAAPLWKFMAENRKLLR